MTNLSLQRSQILSERIPISLSPHGTSGCAANVPKEYSVCTSIIAVVYHFFEGYILSCFRCLAIKISLKGYHLFQGFWCCKPVFRKSVVVFSWSVWKPLDLWLLNGIEYVCIRSGVFWPFWSGVSPIGGYFGCFLAFWLVIFSFSSLGLLVCILFLSLDLFQSKSRENSNSL